MSDLNDEIDEAAIQRVMEDVGLTVSDLICEAGTSSESNSLQNKLQEDQSSGLHIATEEGNESALENSVSDKMECDDTSGLPEDDQDRLSSVFGMSSQGLEGRVDETQIDHESEMGSDRHEDELIKEEKDGDATK